MMEMHLLFPSNYCTELSVSMRKKSPSVSRRLKQYHITSKSHPKTAYNRGIPSQTNVVHPLSAAHMIDLVASEMYYLLGTR